MMESESTALPLGYTPKWYSAERFRLATYIVYHIPQGLSRKKRKTRKRKVFSCTICAFYDLYLKFAGKKTKFP